MIKNIVLDIGGIIADDGAKKYTKDRYKERLNYSLEEIRKIGKIAFGTTFNDCLKGTISINEHIIKICKQNKELENELKYMLTPELYEETYPVIKETLDYIYKLKNNGYKIYFLSNITKESYEYLKTILENFDGGIYSFQENTIKPEEKIYKRLFEKYNLDNRETMFFDDKLENVEASIKAGLNAKLYKELNDLKKIVEGK